MEPLTWDATYAIAMALKRLYPNQNLNDVSLRKIYQWTIALPEFADDPALANEDILTDIYLAWYEETIHDH
jgi:FeS assembly protein IscX